MSSWTASRRVEDPGAVQLEDLAGRRVLLVGATAVAAFELTSLLLVWLPWLPFTEPGRLGTVPLSYATLPALVLVVALLAQDRTPAGWWWFAAAMGAIVTSAGIVAQGSVEVAGILIGSAVEEVAYRIALPILVIVTLRRCRVGSGVAVLAGLVVSTAVFTLLPGHLAQAPTWTALLPFAAVAVLWYGAVWRAGAPMVAVTGHAIVNLTILPVETGAVGVQLRTVAVVVVVVASATAMFASVRRRALSPLQATVADEPAAAPAATEVP